MNKQKLDITFIRPFYTFWDFTKQRRRRITQKHIFSCLLFVLICISTMQNVSFMFFCAPVDRRKDLEPFLEAHKCPTCFGTSVCAQFYFGQMDVEGFPGFSLFFKNDPKTQRNVYYGKMGKDNRNIIVKKISVDLELKQFYERLTESDISKNNNVNCSDVDNVDNINCHKRKKEIKTSLSIRPKRPGGVGATTKDGDKTNKHLRNTKVKKTPDLTIVDNEQANQNIDNDIKNNDEQLNLNKKDVNTKNSVHTSRRLAAVQGRHELHDSDTRTFNILPSLRSDKDQNLLQLLKGTGSLMFSCPTERLLARVWSNYKEFSRTEQSDHSARVQVYYTSMVNQESLMLQTFPSSEGWPFPAYLGSCGRAVIIENVGKPLSQFLQAPFNIRAGLAYKLLKLAETLSDNDGYSLYLTDVTLDNFASADDGTVKLIDVEGIFVVDNTVDTQNDLRQSSRPVVPIKACHSPTCLPYSPTELCKKRRPAHNLWAVCRNLLMNQSPENGRIEGLLHNIPGHINFYWKLGQLLHICATSKADWEKLKVIGKLLTALAAISNNRLHPEILITHLDNELI